MPKPPLPPPDDARTWCPNEVDVTGWTIKGSWRGKLGAVPRVTGIVVTNGTEDRMVYYDHTQKALRSVPFPVKP